MEKYKKIDTIGRDWFGEAFKCINTETEDYVLVKETNFDLDVESEGVPSKMIRKFSRLRDLDHPNVLRLLDFVADEEHNRVFHVFECGDLNLKTSIEENPDISKDLCFVKSILRPILHYVSYYHSNKMIHGDLSPQLVMIFPQKDAVKIADIQLDVIPTYKAPEILLGVTGDSYARDIWSVGCIFSEMVNQQPLFSGPTDFHELLSIFSVMGTPTEESWPEATARFNTIRPIQKTPPMDFAAAFPHLEKAGVDLLSKMLRLDPKKRITVSEALEHEFFRDTSSSTSLSSH